ncbi:hypothetical protein [Nostoc sp.]|uniref:hypothetical protein n=1 Tax=Nostoc sp. TaxID=1180 RepID=UPI002FF88856
MCPGEERVFSIGTRAIAFKQLTVSAEMLINMFCDGDFNPDPKQAVYRNGGINPYSITIDK